MVMAIRNLVLCWLCVGLHQNVQAQQGFQLQVPGSNVSSRAEMRGQSLLITDQNGGVSRYHRDARFDSDDQRFIGFYDNQTQQVLQWPITNQGNFRIGRASAGGWIYTTSQMVIQTNGIFPPNTNPGPPPFPNPPLPGAAIPGAPLGGIPQEIGFYRLTSLEASQVGTYLDSGVGVQIRMAPRGPENFQAWRLIPIIGDVVRIEGSVNGMAQSLASFGPGGPLGFAVPNQSPNQLWRCLSVAGQPRAVWFENVAFPGQSFTGHANGLVDLTPYVGFPAQQWYLELLTPTQPYLPPIRSVSKDITPNPPLPPAEIQFINPTNRDLIVLIGDRRNGRTPKQVRVPAQGQFPCHSTATPEGSLSKFMKRDFPMARSIEPSLRPRFHPRVTMTSAFMNSH